MMEDYFFYNYAYLYSPNIAFPNTKIVFENN